MLISTAVYILLIIFLILTILFILFFAPATGPQGQAGFRGFIGDPGIAGTAGAAGGAGSVGVTGSVSDAFAFYTSNPNPSAVINPTTKDLSIYYPLPEHANGVIGGGYVEYVNAKLLDTAPLYPFATLNVNNPIFPIFEPESTKVLDYGDIAVTIVNSGVDGYYPRFQVKRGDGITDFTDDVYLIVKVVATIITELDGENSKGIMYLGGGPVATYGSEFGASDLYAGLSLFGVANSAGVKHVSTVTGLYNVEGSKLVDPVSIVISQLPPSVGIGNYIDATMGGKYFVADINYSFQVIRV